MALTRIFVDGQAHEVDAERNLLDVCLTLGYDLPYFCWHPALGSVGACRQCAVKLFRDEKDSKGRIVMACLTPVAKDMRISISDPEACTFRAGVVQGLMQNHPHDCPVCDEGGECHLQDMTVMTGHAYRRYSFPKRTFRNQYLGPFLNHEMNRCIQCYRCVRFYRDYAGGRDFEALGLRDRVFFGRARDGVLESEFAGNLVEVCPTGVFTDKTLKRHYTRKWDLTNAPSVCVHCGLGCSTTTGERYGALRRILNRYNSEVNGYFLCDRGRFGYEFVNSARRIRRPRLRRDDRLVELSAAAALEQAVAWLAPGQRVLGIGSPRASLEANFALRELVGAESFYAGITVTEWTLLEKVVEVLRKTPARSASLRDVASADAVLVLGEDVTQTAPLMALSLRQASRQEPMRIPRSLHIPEWHDHAVREAVQDARGPFFLATPSATKLDELATVASRLAPAEIARLGFAVAHALDSQAPDAPDLAPGTREVARRIAEALRRAERPLVVSGASLGSTAIVEAAANVARALCRAAQPARLALIVPSCNSLGLALMAPQPIDAALSRVQSGTVDALVVLENDLYRSLSTEDADALLTRAPHVAVLDQLETDTSRLAELVLPASTFAEAEGTFVNSEGRAQRAFAALPPQDGVRPSWSWLSEAGRTAGRTAPGERSTLDALRSRMSGEWSVFAGIAQAAPPAEFRLAHQKVPRQPHRASGRTAMRANVDVHEPKPPEDPTSPLSFSMEGNPNQPPAALTPFFWSPGWNSIQSVNKYQTEIAGPMRGGDAGVRLLEPLTDAGAYYAAVEEPFVPRAGEWLLVPQHHIFGSDELSHAAPAVRELVPQPYVGMSAEDAADLGWAAGQAIRIAIDEVELALPLRVLPGMVRGVAALPVGLPGSAPLLLPGWARLSRG